MRVEDLTNDESILDLDWMHAQLHPHPQPQPPPAPREPPRPPPPQPPRDLSAVHDEARLLRLLDDRSRGYARKISESTLGTFDFIHVKEWGVMGDASLPGGQVVPADPRPTARDDIIVYLAEVSTIQTDCSRATGAARDIYQWARLPPNCPFPPSVIDELTDRGRTQFFVYCDKAIIHVLSPDLRVDAASLDEAVDALAPVYGQIFTHFVWQEKSILRLPPIATRQLAGPLAAALPAITACALEQALNALDDWHRMGFHTRRVHLCVQSQADIPLYREQIGAKAPPWSRVTQEAVHAARQAALRLQAHGESEANVRARVPAECIAFCAEAWRTSTALQYILEDLYPSNSVSPATRSPFPPSRPLPHPRPPPARG